MKLLTGSVCSVVILLQSGLVGTCSAENTLPRRGLSSILASSRAQETPKWQQTRAQQRAAVASPVPTAAPRVNPASLLRRADGDSICGYISGIKTFASAVMCGVDWACVPELGGKFFGCSKGGEAFYETACFNSDQLTTNTDEHRTLWCNFDPSIPYCAMATYTDAEYAGYSNMYCNDVPGTFPISHSPSVLIQTTTQTPSTSVATVTKEGETKIVTQSAETKTVVDNGGTTSSSTTTTAVGGGHSAGGDGAAAGGGAARGAGSSETSEASGAPKATAQDTDGAATASTFPVATVVGGAIGGVAVIGLIALAFFIVIRRGKQKQQPPSDSSPAMIDHQPQQQLQRHSIYPTYPNGLEVALPPPKPSPSPPSSTSSPRIDGHAFPASPTTPSPVQQQQQQQIQHESVLYPAYPINAHTQQRQSGYGVFQETHAPHHAELPAYLQQQQQQMQQQHQQQQQVSTQHQSAQYGQQTAFVVQRAAEMPVERGDMQPRELGGYR